ncbi:hypothetical protein SALBM135S_04305 [Streptomyces alboniger]
MPPRGASRTAAAWRTRIRRHASASRTPASTDAVNSPRLAPSSRSGRMPEAMRVSAAASSTMTIAGWVNAMSSNGSARPRPGA